MLSLDARRPLPLKALVRGGSGRATTESRTEPKARMAMTTQNGLRSFAAPVTAASRLADPSGSLASTTYPTYEKDRLVPGLAGSALPGRARERHTCRVRTTWLRLVAGGIAVALATGACSHRAAVHVGAGETTTTAVPICPAAVTTTSVPE